MFPVLISEMKTLINLVQSGVTKNEVDKQFGIVQSTFSIIINNKDRIISIASEGRKNVNF